MNYIYDIVLNFQDNYYNFFEWSKLDIIKNKKKIPVYRISDEDLLSLKNNQVIVDNPFLNKIFTTTTKKEIAILVSNTKLAIGLLIDKEGLVKQKSSLIFEEEEEVNNICQSLTITKINYKKNIPQNENNKLRIEIEKKDKLIKFIKDTNNQITLKYLLYEYYNKESNNITKIKKLLLEELNKPWNSKQNKLYNIMKLLTNNNLPIK